jgi:hypothetical protein
MRYEPNGHKERSAQIELDPGPPTPLVVFASSIFDGTRVCSNNKK